ncbi:MAG: hypothetical protein LBJ13_01265 [Puniceicoccales bacterium]|jgi:hypothetical protein|nr:hypothetical protein [Puniceicoccales bacterium]
MDYEILNRKIQLIALFLTVPFQVSLQASDEDIGDDLQPLPTAHHSSLAPYSQEQHNQTCSPEQEQKMFIYRIKNKALTPKEKQISKFAECQFFQLQNNNTVSQSSSIGLYALAAIEQKFRNDEVEADQPIALEYDKLKQIAAQFFPNYREPLNATVNSYLVQQVAQEIGKPVFFINIGNRGHSYGPGPIDIVKWIIFAKPDTEVLVQNSWFWDNNLLGIISQCDSEAVIVCYNSFLKRTLLSMPNDQNFTTAQEDYSQAQLNRTAILSIKKNRIIRNIGFLASLAACTYACKTTILPMITESQIAQHTIEILKSLRQQITSNFFSQTTPLPDPSPMVTPLPSTSPTEPSSLISAITSWLKGWNIL